MNIEKKRMFWNHLNTIEDFNKFIEENDIKSPSDFRERFRGAYDRSSRLKIIKNLFYKSRRFCWDHLNTVNDFNDFIKKNNIKNPKEFEENFPGGHTKAKKLKILKNLVYNSKENSWENFNTIDDFNDFIKKNNIINSVDFYKRFGGGYNKAKHLGLSKNLIYCSNGDFKSSWEKILYNIIDKDPDFFNLRKEVVFEDCKNKKELPFDLMFSFSKKPNIKIIIEVQGPTHYAAIYKSEKKYISIRKNDIIKNKWAREKEDVYLFYYSELNEHLNDNCYPYYIYTSIKELINDIKKLI